MVASLLFLIGPYAKLDYRSIFCTMIYVCLVGGSIWRFSKNTEWLRTGNMPPKVMEKGIYI